MTIVNGWKEIGECLRVTARTTEKWERLGLPVRRVSNTSRSAVVAFSNEIENGFEGNKSKLDLLRLFCWQKGH